MSDRDKAMYHLHQWWLAGNDETLHHAGAELLGVMVNNGWVMRGKRKTVTEWENGQIDTYPSVRSLDVHCLTDKGRAALMDWRSQPRVSGKKISAKDLTP